MRLVFTWLEPHDANTCTYMLCIGIKRRVGDHWGAQAEYMTRSSDVTHSLIFSQPYATPHAPRPFQSMILDTVRTFAFHFSVTVTPIFNLRPCYRTFDSDIPDLFLSASQVFRCATKYPAYVHVSRIPHRFRFHFATFTHAPPPPSDLPSSFVFGL